MQEKIYLSVLHSFFPWDLLFSVYFWKRWKKKKWRYCYYLTAAIETLYTGWRVFPASRTVYSTLDIAGFELLQESAILALTCLQIYFPDPKKDFHTLKKPIFQSKICYFWARGYEKLFCSLHQQNVKFFSNRVSFFYEWMFVILTFFLFVYWWKKKITSLWSLPCTWWKKSQEKDNVSRGANSTKPFHFIFKKTRKKEKRRQKNKKNNS